MYLLENVQLRDSLPDKTQQPPPLDDTPNQQDVALGKLLSVSVSMFSRENEL